MENNNNYQRKEADHRRFGYEIDLTMNIIIVMKIIFVRKENIVLHMNEIAKKQMKKTANFLVRKPIEEAVA